jgi:hypothetical protein
MSAAMGGQSHLDVLGECLAFGNCAARWVGHEMGFSSFVVEASMRESNWRGRSSEIRPRTKHNPGD